MKKHIWKNQPNDKHTWAFIYYCRRQGDKVTVNYCSNNQLDVHVVIRTKHD